MVTREDLAKDVSGAQHQVAKTDAESTMASTVVVPYGFAKNQGVMLSLIDDNRYELVCRKPVDLNALSEVMRFARLSPHTPLEIDAVRAEDSAVFDSLMAAVYERHASSAEQAADELENLDLESLADAVPETEDLLEQEGDAPIIRLINALLQQAIKEDASDIHIETYEKRLVVRMRVDGVLREVLKPKRELASLLVSRIKVMARLDIAEKRVPQDGRISLRVGGRNVDVRVSTMPSSGGERVVMRLLDKQDGRLDLAQLGMDPATTARLRDLIFKPHGILLVTGPTGSGKTTTLYAALAELNDSTRNILTVEDPVEYQLDGIGQTQVNTKVDMTFARGLRAMLRQDPDVVMVGEIRDLETAEIAVQASLTGHLVLSTLHTNTAVGAVTRLQDMGVEPFLLSSSLIGVLAQRLVRLLCPECRQPHQPDETERAMLGLAEGEQVTIYRPAGCEVCNQRGYKGRTGIYELVAVDDAMRELIHDGASEQKLEKQARRFSPGIREDGIRRVLAGETTIEEVVRVTRGE